MKSAAPSFGKAFITVKPGKITVIFNKISNIIDGKNLNQKNKKLTASIKRKLVKGLFQNGL